LFAYNAKYANMQKMQKKYEKHMEYTGNINNVKPKKKINKNKKNSKKSKRSKSPNKKKDYKYTYTNNKHNRLTTQYTHRIPIIPKNKTHTPQTPIKPQKIPEISTY
jgi:hypothetical protein